MKSSEGKTFKTVNPANEQVIAEIQQSGKADVGKAVQAAKDAFKWVLYLDWIEKDSSYFILDG